MLQPHSTIHKKLPRHPLDDAIGLRYGSYTCSAQDLAEFRELLRSELPSSSWNDDELLEMAKALLVAVATLVATARDHELRRVRRQQRISG